MTAVKVSIPEGLVFVCRANSGVEIAPGKNLIVELDYGLELGQVEGVLQWEQERGAPPSFRVVRGVVDSDRRRIDENAKRAAIAKERFDSLSGVVAAGVKTLSARFSYGGERLFLRYAAPSPVNLRKLIPQLQSEFKASVDLWQLSGRERASKLGCLGVCGRTACCSAWMKQPPNVTIRMMRDQALPINSASINGVCGKMKCCVAFESEKGMTAIPKEDDGGQDREI